MYEKLKLRLNPKTNYFKNNQGINFCGYKLKGNKIYIAKSNKKKIYKNVRKWNKLYKLNQLDLMKAGRSLVSWKGHASHCSYDEIVRTVMLKCDWIINI